MTSEDHGTGLPRQPCFFVPAAAALADLPFLCGGGYVLFCLPGQKRALLFRGEKKGARYRPKRTTKERPAAAEGFGSRQKRLFADRGTDRADEKSLPPPERIAGLCPFRARLCARGRRRASTGASRRGLFAEKKNGCAGPGVRRGKNKRTRSPRPFPPTAAALPRKRKACARRPKKAVRDTAAPERAAVRTATAFAVPQQQKKRAAERRVCSRAALPLPKSAVPGGWVPAEKHADRVRCPAQRVLLFRLFPLKNSVPAPPGSDRCPSPRARWCCPPPRRAAAR